MHFNKKNASQKRLDLVNSLKSKKLLRFPGAYNPLCAKLIAEIGSNLVNQRGLLINELIGISIQKMAMDNMNDEDPSPFEGMNIIQAKKNLELQKKEIRDSAATDVIQISDLDHETIIKWSNLILEKGEFEANRWIKSKLNSQ